MTEHGSAATGGGSRGGGADKQQWYAEAAYVGGMVETNVLIETAGDRITAVTPATTPPPDAVRLPGLTLPGLANAHSHAFHRALRGRTQAGEGTFWTWREQMYEAVAGLDPETYLELATGVFAEMALAGITAVGEFHYAHHDKGGKWYPDPNAMGHALIEAARAAGLRITLLDTCYLTGGIGSALNPTQRRFSDGDADTWASRVEDLRGAYLDASDVIVGTAIHSVRAVPKDQLGTVAATAARFGAPLHVHLSEQRKENDDCLARYRLTPAQLLDTCGALGPGTTAVHATHLSQADVELLGDSETCVCMCPTTERDLADGIGAARTLFEAGAPIALGSDSHAVIDLFEEARAMELDERLRTERRGHWPSADLIEAATQAGHESLGWADGGRLHAGGLADFVTVGLDSIRLTGTTPDVAAESVVYAATAADVRHVVVGGRIVVRDGVHMLVDNAPRRLGDAIRAVYRRSLTKSPYDGRAHG
ncbi:MAG TPA: formimidoylglutamate deiminase [Actinocrinis sp.]|jgi:formiminoglutamate deiminase|uniref:formimidoylglutamate deiminase n=1 Tax=Actinocrinis sp. TaxID=1920516 RepID=UPI002DDD2E2B|nr:formimidoylglutamate deiminase [Actinocrinis sp.]HEV3173932.1 formimidoylglutamate deiminase [Actinocrinis sp.]